MRKDVKVPSPRIHLALFRDPDVYGFFYNNTLAVAEGETAQQGLVSTGWGNGSDSRLSTTWAARSLIITTAALQHLDTPTESRDQAEATPVEL